MQTEWLNLSVHPSLSCNKVEPRERPALGHGRSCLPCRSPPPSFAGSFGFAKNIKTERGVGCSAPPLLRLCPGRSARFSWKWMTRWRRRRLMPAQPPAAGQQHTLPARPSSSFPATGRSTVLGFRFCEEGGTPKKNRSHTASVAVERERGGVEVEVFGF